MSKSALKGIGLQFFAEPSDTPPAPPATEPAQPGTTPPQAATVDTEAITRQAAQKAEEAAEKKMEAVFKSMLEQQGLDAEAIAKMTADWKSKQKTPEQITKEKDDEITRLTGELTAAQNAATAAAKGIPEGMISDYVTLAAAQDGDTFAKKLEKALEKFPLKKDGAPPPPYASGTGKNPMLPQSEKEQIMQATKDAMRIK